MNISNLPPPFCDLPTIIGGVRGQVGNWAARKCFGPVLMFLLYRRLGEIGRRIEGLLARYLAGVVLRRAVRVVLPAEAGVVPVLRGPRDWPGQFAWLVRMVGWQSAGYGSQLRHFLARPEVVEMLAACPQARRILTPLCRMLAVETAVLTPWVPVVVVPVVRAKRVRAPRVAVDFGRIPLPRGILTAARRRRFRTDD